MKVDMMKTWFSPRLFSGIILFALLVGMSSTPFAEEIVIIANERFPVDSIAPIDVMSIYSGHYVMYKGSTIYPLDQADDQRIKPNFLEKALKFTPATYKAYWLKWTFKTGRQPPVVMKDSKEVIQTVQNQEGGLGYAWDHEIQGVTGLKILLRIPVSE